MSGFGTGVARYLADMTLYVAVGLLISTLTDSVHIVAIILLVVSTIIEMYLLYGGDDTE